MSETARRFLRLFEIFSDKNSLKALTLTLVGEQCKKFI